MAEIYDMNSSRVLKKFRRAVQTGDIEEATSLWWGHQNLWDNMLAIDKEEASSRAPISVRMESF